MSVLSIPEINFIFEFLDPEIATRPIAMYFLLFLYKINSVIIYE